MSLAIHAPAGPDAASPKLTSYLEQREEPLVTGLLNLEFTNYHLTVRGVDKQNRGLVSQPKLVLNWHLYRDHDPAAVVNELRLVTGLWNEVDSKQSGVRMGNWNETNVLLGLNLTFAKDWSFEANFTDFISQTHNFPTAWGFAPRVTYHDHWVEGLSFNPYVEYFDELSNKLVSVFNRPRAQSSYYFNVGFDPTYKIADVPLTLDLPSYILLPAKNFYQRRDGSGGGTKFGLITTMLRATVPLEFVPKSCGTWSFYAGVQYDYLNNPGLLDGNQYRGIAQRRERNLLVYHAGLNIRF